MRQQADVVIIGGGPAGMSAAIWCKRLGLSHLMIETEAELGGQLAHIFNPLIDYPGILASGGQELREKFVEHVKALDCSHVVRASVLRVDVQAKRVEMESDGEQAEVPFRGLILATGAGDRRLGVPGEQAMIERGEVYSTSRDRDRFAGKRVAVVGGGDRALEGALLLAERGAEVVLIHRTDQYRARPEFIEPVLQHPKIERLPFANVTHVFGDGKVEGIAVRLQNGEEKKLDAEALFVRIGVAPNSRLVIGQVKTDADGYILTDSAQQTDCEGVFAVGDVCTRPLHSGIASAVGQGMIAAKQLSLFLAQEGAEM